MIRRVVIFPERVTRWTDPLLMVLCFNPSVFKLTSDNCRHVTTLADLDFLNETDEEKGDPRVDQAVVDHDNDDEQKL